MKIEELLQKGKEKLIENKIEDAFLIARMLLEFTLKISRNAIIVNKDKKVEKEEEKRYLNLVEEIVKGKPIQYITNKQEFMNLQFYVNENVLIPQPDTEILVEEVINISNKESKKEILDMCTGSGCIGISLAYYIENSNLTLSDISKKALEIATKNAKDNKVLNKIKFIESDMFKNIQGTFDIIVSNPPYIETNVIFTLDKQVQQEPLLALDGGKDGLDFYKILIDEAIIHLKENGYLCMEIGYNQREKVTDLIRKTNKFKNIYSKKDLSGNDRIVICKKM